MDYRCSSHAIHSFLRQRLLSDLQSNMSCFAGRSSEHEKLVSLVSFDLSVFKFIHIVLQPSSFLHLLVFYIQLGNIRGTDSIEHQLACGCALGFRLNRPAHMNLTCWSSSLTALLATSTVLQRKGRRPPVRRRRRRRSEPVSPT